MNTIKKIKTIVSTAVFALAFCGAAFAVDVTEGMWEVTATMSMAGMPPMTNTTKQCITKDSLVPKMDEKSNCSIQDMKTSGNKVSWKISCKQDGTSMTGNGEVTYNKTTYDGNMSTTMSMQGQPPMKANYKMKGKRIGDCAKK